MLFRRHEPEAPQGRELPRRFRLSQRTLTRTGVYTAVDTSYTVEPFKRAAVRKAIMLFAMSAEFNAHVGSAGHHSSSTTGGAVQQQRSPQPDIPSQGRPYKALVVMYLAGGVDSWNLIVPKSGCTGGRDLFADYTAARGLAALSASQLQSVTVSSGQPCTTFGVHEHLPNIKRMFDAGDASFVGKSLLQAVGAPVNVEVLPCGGRAH